MLIGLMADTHDCLPLIEKAIITLNRENVGLVLHAGDFVAPFVISKFNNLQSKLIGVFGNNDGDRVHLVNMFTQHQGFKMHGAFAKINIDGVKIALLHGDDSELLEALIEDSCFHIIVHGHTHNPSVVRKGKMLVVNPGEVCGYLTGRSTIALLDSDKLEVSITEL